MKDYAEMGRSKQEQWMLDTQTEKSRMELEEVLQRRQTDKAESVQINQNNTEYIAKVLSENLRLKEMLNTLLGYAVCANCTEVDNDWKNCCNKPVCECGCHIVFKKVDELLK